DVLVVLGALQRDVRADNRGRLGDVEPLALRQALDDVEQDHVAEFLAGADVGQRAPDHARSDEGDLRTRHPQFSVRGESVFGGSVWKTARSRPAARRLQGCGMFELDPAFLATSAALPALALCEVRLQLDAR